MAGPDCQSIYAVSVTSEFVICQINFFSHILPFLVSFFQFKTSKLQTFVILCDMIQDCANKNPVCIIVFILLELFLGKLVHNACSTCGIAAYLLMLKTDYPHLSF